MLANRSDVARRWAIEGMGIWYKSWLDVCRDVENNRLEVVLPERPGETAPLNLICPHRKQFSPPNQNPVQRPERAPGSNYRGIGSLHPLR